MVDMMDRKPISLLQTLSLYIYTYVPTHLARKRLGLTKLREEAINIYKQEECIKRRFKQRKGLDRTEDIPLESLPFVISCDL